MKLYQIPSCPYCQRVCRKLDDIGLEYEEVEVPLPHEERDEVYRLSGQRAVPVLVDEDGEVVSDSSRIVRYLESKYG
ncbi:MAG: hypothetical protein MAG715_01160 [Methanonatronarchaeales archaeon]|nr:hypothetical protein [Methanonatronarchaeales archaeon]